ncbi:hypothetical protein K2D_34500 [Planctomycetes bacterium K2D]|uniref:Polysaccharide biosynthesis protein n=2 Tax=Botrimarina mediterranea TaxID=2528022 RepID=A0A518KBL5_9BACT|nr:hypothetical protein Spa11_33980 [Botrimarina mediterranea]QDV79831.1 hypothetical protein K2D_34500 [Planctomycetes bacterium K2D]
MAGGIVGIGFGAAATTALAARLHSDPKRALSESAALGSATIGVSLLGAIALATLSGPIARITTGQAEFASHFATGAFLVVLNAIAFYQAGVLAGLSAFRPLAFAQATGGIVAITCVAVGIRLGQSHGALVGLSIGALATCFLLNREVQRSAPLWAFDWKQGAWRSRFAIWSMGLPSVLLLGLSGPADWWGLAALARQPDGLVEVGVYSAANQIGTLLRFAPLSVGIALQSHLAKQFSDGAIAHGRDSMKRAVLAICAGGVLVLAIATPLAPWIMRAYGPAYADRTEVLVALIAAGVAVALQVMVERSLLAIAGYRNTLTIGLTRSAIFVVVAPWAVTGGAAGLAVLRTVVSVVHAFALIWLWRRSIGTAMQASLSGDARIAA